MKKVIFTISFLFFSEALMAGNLYRYFGATRNAHECAFKAHEYGCRGWRFGNQFGAIFAPNACVGYYCYSYPVTPVVPVHPPKFPISPYQPQITYVIYDVFVYEDTDLRECRKEVYRIDKDAQCRTNEKEWLLECLIPKSKHPLFLRAGCVEDFRKQIVNQNNKQQ